MNEFIEKEGDKFARLINANTRDYEKLTNLQVRFEKELLPFTDPENKIKFLNSLESGVRKIFGKHINECKKVDTCPQHKTYKNSLFLIAQARNLFTIENRTMQSTKQGEYMLDIFISHSSQDAEIVKLLIELIRSALNLSADKIRCTSISGYKLPAGASTDDQLRAEIFDSKVFIGVISPNSINSVYVAFELGARWGNKLPLFPLITNKMGAQLLKGPLKSINALNSCIRADLFQLINDLGKVLGKTPEFPSVYEGKLEELLTQSLKETLPSGESKKARPTLPEAYNDLSDAEVVIKDHCQKDWPDDYTMQLHCIHQQRQAVSELDMPRPDDLTDAEFAQIKTKAMREWPEDFVMQLHAQKTQIESLRQLRKH